MVNECTSETAITLHFTHMHCLGIFEITTLWPGQWRVDPWRGTEERGKDKGTLPGHPHTAPPQPPWQSQFNSISSGRGLVKLTRGPDPQWSGHAGMHACVPLTSRASIFESRIHLDPEWPGSTYGLIGIHREGFAAFLDSRADQSFRPGCPTQ